MTPTLRSKITLPTLIAALILALIYLYFFAFKTHVELEINLHHQSRGWLKVYWADEGQDFSEKRMQQVRIGAHKERYSFDIDSLHRIKRLRIDPVEFKAELLLKKLKLSQAGFVDNEVSWVYGFKGLEAIKQIADINQTELGLLFKTTGRDGQFEYQVDNTFSDFPVIHLLSAISIMFFTLVVGGILGSLQKKIIFVPILMLVAVCLAFIMATVSKQYTVHPNGTRLYIHPDEEAHITGVDYYRNHLLPPAIDSPLAANTFSIYGYSRLSSYELYYPITGYLTRLMEPFKQSVIINARVINVGFLLLLAIFAYRREQFRPFVLPLLITPQLWYLYSYSNSDSFGVSIATIVAYQAAYQNSALNRLLTEARPNKFALNALWLGLLMGALLLLKVNFYAFILFLGLYLLWRIMIGDFPNQKRLWTRLLLVCVIGGSIYGGRVGLEYAANGADSKQKIAQMIELKAQKLYKPSTVLSKKHIHLYMKKRGVSLSRIIERDRWGGRTFYNSFGSYGFTEFFASSRYYAIVRLVGLAALGVLLCSLLVRAPASLHWLFAITLACAILLILLGFWRAWTISFQPQGRYLTPILPMLGILYYHSRQWLFYRTFNALTITLFALGVYSFIFFGFALIPKT